MGKIKILKAIYYNPKIGTSTGTDVTRILSDYIKNYGSIYEGCYNNIFPDNFKGIRKELVVEAKINWKKYTKIYKEDEKIDLLKDLKIKESYIKIKKFLDHPWTIAIGGVIFATILGYIFLKQPATEYKQSGENNQIHTGVGDNVAGDKIINNVAEDNKLRQLEPLESGKIITDLPDGVYFFEYASNIELAIKYSDLADVVAKKITAIFSSDIFEIQKKGGQNLLVGFINSENYSKIGGINNENPLKNFVLFPRSFNEYTKLVAIPFDKINYINQRNLDTATGYIDVLDVTATEIILDVISYKN